METTVSAHKTGTKLRKNISQKGQAIDKNSKKHPKPYRISFFAHPLCASLSCLQYGISFGNKKPDNVDRDYIVLLSNLIEEGTVQCIVE